MEERVKKKRFTAVTLKRKRKVYFGCFAEEQSNRLDQISIGKDISWIECILNSLQYRDSSFTCCFCNRSQNTRTLSSTAYQASTSSSTFQHHDDVTVILHTCTKFNKSIVTVQLPDDLISSLFFNLKIHLQRITEPFEFVAKIEVDTCSSIICLVICQSVEEQIVTKKMKC